MTLLTHTIRFYVQCFNFIIPISPFWIKRKRLSPFSVKKVVPLPCSNPPRPPPTLSQPRPARSCLRISGSRAGAHLRTLAAAPRAGKNSKHAADKHHNKTAALELLRRTTSVLIWLPPKGKKYVCSGDNNCHCTDSTTPKKAWLHAEDRMQCLEARKFVFEEPFKGVKAAATLSDA